MGMLRLSFQGLVAECKNFLSKELPRVEVNPATVDYNQSGASVLRGPEFEPKYIWTVNPLVSPDVYDVLCLMYAKSEVLRRTNGNPAIALDDYTEPVRETTRTRNLATGATEQPMSGGVKYNAQFNVFFVKPPKAAESGDNYAVSFVLAEL